MYIKWLGLNILKNMFRCLLELVFSMKILLVILLTFFTSQLVNSMPQANTWDADHCKFRYYWNREMPAKGDWMLVNYQWWGFDWNYVINCHYWNDQNKQ